MTWQKKVSTLASTREFDFTGITPATDGIVRQY
jgi:hypothetical protein